MSLWDTIYDIYVNNVDKRTETWFLVGSTSSLLMIYAVYFLFVFYIGPRYMKNREPYSLKTFIQCYDIFQILMNSYIIYLFLDAGWYQDIWIYCVPSDYSTNPAPMKIAAAMWWTMILKFIDLIETGIYVLRKKNNQISVLHLYHHITTALIAWLSLRYIAAGMASFIPIVNCSVHIIMYTYYFLATLGPKVLRIIVPYKWILTVIQMTQFVLLILYIMQSFSPNCPVAKIPGSAMVVNILINFYLFYNFYKKTYKSSKPKRK